MKLEEKLACAYMCLALIDGKVHEDEKNYILDVCEDDEVEVNFINEQIDILEKKNKEELENNFFEYLKEVNKPSDREVIFQNLEKLAKIDTYLHPEEDKILRKLGDPDHWNIKRKFDFRKGLDKEQRKIVERRTSDRIIVFSAPGCGKTHVAGNRASYIMKDLKINPSSIIMISFTRTAVKEFRERVDQITDLNIGELKIITLDSFAFEYLHGFGDAKNSSSYFTGTYEENISKFMEMIKGKNSDVMEHLKEIKHIIIDEAQDITGIRGKLVETIIGSVDQNCGFTIFGDPDQAIYDWTDEDADKTNIQENFMNTIKKGQFKIMQLEKNYRMKNKKLVKLSMDLRPSNNNKKDSDYFKILNDNKKKLLNNFKDKQQTFEDDMKKVDKRKGNLFLFRRKAEMMRAAERALKNGFKPALRFGGSQDCIYPWVGSIFYDHKDKLISKNDFINKWFERCLVGNISSEMEPEEAWNKLIKTAKKKNDVDLTLLRKKLSLKPPLDLCLTDYGLSNLIFGTIHASKGREADTVYYYTDPPKEKKSDKPNYEEENRVVYVACTRAIENFYAKNIKEKEILGFATSDTVNNRTYLNTLSKDKKRLIRILVGLKNDFDDLSLVSKRIVSAGEGYTKEKVLETQKFLKRKSYNPFEISCFPMSASLGREEENLSYSSKYNYNMLVYEKNKERKPSFGSLNSRRFGSIVQNILKRASGSRMYKVGAIYNIWVIGCRTAVIDENDANLAEVHEPFSETGFWLTPIITGWGTVVSAPKAWAKKFI